MSNQIQVSIDQDVYNQLQLLMVPPVNDTNAVIKELLWRDGRASQAAVEMGAAGQHYTYAQELDRAREGVYDSGGNA